MADAIQREVKRSKRLAKYAADVQARHELDEHHFKAHMELVLDGITVRWTKRENGALTMEVDWPREAIQALLNKITTH